MLITIFYHVDEFCKFFRKEAKKHLLSKKELDSFRSQMTLSEVMTIMIYWHLSGYKNFKAYYTKHVQVHLRSDFPKLVSYTRFVELMKVANLPMFVFAKCLGNECTGTSFVDSAKLAVCNNRRIYSHKVFKGFAQRGHTSMGWFFGFKLHLITDDQGDIIDFTLTSGNVHDANKTVIDSLIKKIHGILVGDKGYIGLFEHLYNKGIKLVHRLRSNMKNQLITLYEKSLLRRRGSIIETTIGILKEHLSLEHSRHRSILNFLTHTFSCIVAFSFFRYQNNSHNASLANF